MLSRLNIFLAVLLVIVFALPIVTRVNYSKPNYEFLPEMKYSPAWSAYDANPNFDDGPTLQAPVPGTIPRGQMPVHFAPVEKEGDTPGAELLNPYDLLLAEPATDDTGTDERAPDKTATNETDSGEAGENPQDDKVVSDEAAKEDAEADEQENERQQREADAQEQLRASVERGGNLYRVFCICCHGASGDGKGPVSTRGFPSPTLLAEPVREKSMKDGQLFYILTKGRDTDWPGSMLPFAGQLSGDQRWDVINYLRILQERTPASAAEETATPAAEDQETPTTKEGAEPEPKTETDSSDAPANESTTTESKGQDDVD